MIEERGGGGGLRALMPCRLRTVTSYPMSEQSLCGTRGLIAWIAACTSARFNQSFHRSSVLGEGIVAGPSVALPYGDEYCGWGNGTSGLRGERRVAIGRRRRAQRLAHCLACVARTRLSLHALPSQLFEP